MHYVNIAIYSQMLQLSVSSPEWEYVFLLLLVLLFELIITYKDQKNASEPKLNYFLVQTETPKIISVWTKTNKNVLVQTDTEWFRTPAPHPPTISTGCCLLCFWSWTLNVHNQGINTFNNASNTTYTFIQYTENCFCNITVVLDVCLVGQNTVTEIWSNAW